MKEKSKDKDKLSAQAAEDAAAEESVTAEESAAEQAQSGDDVLDREALGDEKYIEALEERVGKCVAETMSAKNIAMRLQADFDNYRKRNASLAEEMKALGKSMVIEKMLTVLDNCDLARKYISDESALTGFNMMERQILDALESFGLKEIDAADKDFDAAYMSAVEREKAEGKEGKVVEVLAKGYTLNGKVLLERLVFHLAARGVAAVV